MRYEPSLGLRPASDEAPVAKSFAQRYVAHVTIRKTISRERLTDLDVRPGDTLHILAITDAGTLIQINREDEKREPALGKASLWLRSAKGSVHLAEGESLDDARLAFYASKYGVANE